MMRSLHAILKKTVYLTLLLGSFLSSLSFAQDNSIKFTSSDKQLEAAFKWAKGMAVHYKGKPGDPVGPWYESALPPRDAFCMRDVSHQSIGAEILGFSPENKNMLNLFVSNISTSKNWCSYWEINKWGKPSPDDYRNDNEFWYNLPANFDVMSATWRLYQWTGDRTYIDAPVFAAFQKRSVNEYIDSWVLAADSMLSRPAHPNAPLPYNEKDSFHRCRGLPSYSEGVPDLKTGADLIAALYRGMTTYAEILSEKGLKDETALYTKKAEQYRKRLEADWWNEKEGRYYTYYSNTGKFGMDEGETFLLWFDALKDNSRINKTLKHLASRTWNVENTSYLPLVFYRHGDWDQARKYILYLADPATPRREYPEVSFGIIEGVVQGMMGISPDARTRTVSTIFKAVQPGNATLVYLPVLGTVIDITHLSSHQSVITNRGKKPFKWKASFYGNYRYAYANGVRLPVKTETDIRGKTLSFAEISVQPGKEININIEN